MRTLVAGLTGLGLLALTAGAMACCCIPRVSDQAANRPQSQISMPDQKALIFREGDTEHLIISVQYSGQVNQFAWVIPVESRPQVDVLSGAAFHELKTVTTILEPPHSGAGRGDMHGVGAAPPPSVQVLERKESGPFDIAVLKSSTSNGLFTWLHQNGFGLSPAGRANLDTYVRKNWVFVAARIRPTSTSNTAVLNGLQAGTIAPLHIRYRAHDLSYPLHVTAVNPGTSSMDLYVVEDKIADAPGFQDATFHLSPSGPTSFKIDQAPPHALDSANVPTLRKLLPHGGTLHHLTATMSAEERQHDLVFAHMSPRVGMK